MSIPATVRRAFFTAARTWDYLLEKTGERLAWVNSRLCAAATKIRSRVQAPRGSQRIGAAVAGFRRALLSVELLEDRVVPSTPTAPSPISSTCPISRNDCHILT